MQAGFFSATTMPDPDGWGTLWTDPEKVLADLGIKPGTEIAVDLCRGDGLFTRSLADLARHGVAIDIDPSRLACARGKVTVAGDARTCEFIEGNAYDIARPVRCPVEVVLTANT